MFWIIGIRSDVPRVIDAPWNFQGRAPIGPRVDRNLEYIGQLFALRAWYTDVRKRRLSVDQASSHLGMTLDAAIRLLDSSIDERLTRLGQLLGTIHRSLQPIKIPAIQCPLLWADPNSNQFDHHIDWVRSLSREDVTLGISWLQRIVDTFVHTNRISRIVMHEATGFDIICDVKISVQGKACETGSLR